MSDKLGGRRPGTGGGGGGTTHAVLEGSCLRLMDFCITRRRLGSNKEEEGSTRHPEGQRQRSHGRRLCRHYPCALAGQRDTRQVGHVRAPLEHQDNSPTKIVHLWFTMTNSNIKLTLLWGS